MLSSTLELSLHRKGTQHFINADPTDIILTPKTVAYVDGTKSFVSATPRDIQTFKIIWPGDNGIVRMPGVMPGAENGGARRFDFILVGLFDAIVEIGDTWELENQKFVVEYKFPGNDYEVKVGGVSHGSKPTGT